MQASKRTQASIRAELKGLKNRRKERRGERRKIFIGNDVILSFIWMSVGVRIVIGANQTTNSGI